ncbi:hypothetical protein [Spirosoma sp. 48-14]|uniref:hypothetical protein n=1 Tax=Spirosoma sp. 48-14 TaxID=1895854 RepID=UPI00095F2E85|nr:hypothetical protein [Spirosoma sp. 48-14]OJW76351.1 MAG: hypothetical protein BGO59_22795 [Spirosoma sp. 48-14]
MEISYEQINTRIKEIDKNTDAQTLKNLLDKFASGEITNSDQDLLDIINKMKSRSTKGDKISAILKQVSKQEYDQIHQILRENKIFIWSQGDLESYFSKRSLRLSGSKDIRALELSYLLQNENETLESLFLHIEEIKELAKLIVKKS